MSRTGVSGNSVSNARVKVTKAPLMKFRGPVKTEKKNPANPINRVRVVKGSGLPTVRIVSRKASA